MSALDEIRKRAAIDIDQMDPVVAEKLGPFHDMTSNQAIVAALVTEAPDSELVNQVVKQAKTESKTDEEAIDLALDLLTVTLAKSVLPHLTGRVHAQLSPRYAESSTDSLAHGHRLIRLFESNGIPRDRVSLKIPTNGAGMTAAAQLESEGIRTLATILFSVDQALAAVQAGCLYIAPYFNELSVHFEPETWKEYEDTAKEHPMSEVIRRIVEVYKGIEGKKPLVMPASIVTTKEALAISTLGVDHNTISAKVLQALADDRDTKSFRLADSDISAKEAGTAPNGSSKEPHFQDFLADGGKALDESIEADESVSRRFAYACKAFADSEQKVIDVIRRKL